MTLHFTLTKTDAYQSLLEKNVSELCQQLALEERFCFQINLILEEICTNIFENNREAEKMHIDIDISWKKRKITMVIEDNGMLFDPTSVDEPDTSLPLSKREAGGLGLYFVKKYSDTFKYDRVKDRNITIITKSLDSHNKPYTPKTS